MKKNNKYTIFSNFAFVIKFVNEISKMIIPVFCFLIPLGIATPTINSYIPKVLVDFVETKESPMKMLMMVVLLTLMVILINILNKKFSFIADVNSKKISRRFDYVFAQKVMMMDFELFEGPNGRTTYQKAKNSLDHYGAYSYLNYFFDLIKNIAGIGVYCSIIAIVDWRIIPTIIIIELLGGVFATFVRKYDNKIKKRKAIADRKLNYITNTSRDFSFAKDIRLYSMPNFLLDTFKNLLSDKKILTKKSQFFHVKNEVFASLLSLIVTGGTYVYIIYCLFKQNLSSGDVVFYIGIIIGFATWLDGAVDSIDSLLRANHAITDVRKYLDLFDKDSNKKKVSILCEDKQKLEIVFENVSYKYPGCEQYALKNLNFKLYEGEHVAIVGYNGAGKTTLVKLLCGLYTATHGFIKLQGKNINDFNKQDYYSLFSIVFQDIYLLPESVSTNITMTRCNEAKDYKKLILSAEQSGISSKIDCLADGYETLLNKNVNEKAVELSGGESQKISMARAFYKNSPFIILDEPTASLDPIAESEIYEKYSELTTGKTSIFISHRLSSTKFCDRIFFIDNGEIIECGTHDELMELGGQYASLYEVQSQYYKEDVRGNNEGEI